MPEPTKDGPVANERHDRPPPRPTGPRKPKPPSVAWCHYCGRPIPHGKACRYHRDLLALDPVYLASQPRKGTASR